MTEPARQLGRRRGAGTVADDHDSPAGEAEADQLVRRILAGEGELLAVLYDRYITGLYAFVSSLLASERDAEDVIQQVFERLLVASTTGENREVRSVRAWLFTTARNLAIDHRRKHSRIDLMAPFDMTERIARPFGREPGGRAESASRGFDDATIVEKIRLLPVRQREILLLRYVEDFNLREIGEIVGSTEAAIWQAHSRALATLRVLLRSGSGPEPRHRRRPLSALQLVAEARSALRHSFTPSRV